MSEEIGRRLKTLQSEYEAGQKMLADLDARRSVLLSALLRMEGALQVLREMADPAPGDGAAQRASEAAGAPARSVQAAEGRGTESA
jgi:hypothetical protein